MKSGKLLIGMAICIIVALTSLLYAFVQQAEAKRQSQLAEQVMLESQKALVALKDELAQQREIAEEQTAIAQACMLSKK